MKLFFIVPPQEYNEVGSPIDRVYGCNFGFDYKPPIHMLSVASTAARAGHDVRFLDCPAEGIHAEEFEQLIRDSDLQGAFFFTPYLSVGEDRKAAQFIRKHKGEAPPVVFMGAAPSWKPQQFLDIANSWVARGEPELTVLELLELFECGGNPAGINGLSWMEKGTRHDNAFRDLMNVDDLPIPDRRLLLGTYRVNRLSVAPVTTMCVSRGCAFRCKFCAPNAVDQAIEIEYKRLQEQYVKRPPLRKRSTPLVIEEFREVARMGYRGIEVSDNHFLWEKKRTLEICDGIKDLGLEWMCLARAPFLHDPEVLNALRIAGCRMIYIGTESFVQDILDDIRKEIRVEDIFHAVETCEQCGVEPEVSVMMGASPLETPDTIDYSVGQARKLGTRFVHYSVALPFPNTEMYDQVKEQGWFVRGEFEPVDNAREAIINLPHISAKTLEKKMKWAYFRQYYSLRGFFLTLKNVRSPGDLWHKFRMAMKLLFQTFFGLKRKKPS